MTKKTKVLAKNDYTSKTKPTDPGAIPAFDTSVGLTKRDNARPIYVNETALANFNAKVDPHVLKRQIEAANVAALYAKKSLRPDEIAALRRRMFEVVAKGLEDVEEVMAGTKVWSNTQVRLFSILTERVMPKLSTISVEDPGKKKLEELSVEELEAIVMGKKKHDAVDVMVKEGDRLDREAEKTEAISGGLGIRKLIDIASVDGAEKAYVKKKQTPKGVAQTKKPPTKTQKANSPTSTKG